MATLGEQAVGSIVKLNVDGDATNFIVVHQGNPDSSVYDNSCDGTWLLMEDIYEKRASDSSDHDYEDSDIHSYLNNTFVNLFDSDIKSAIKQVKIPYRAGAGSSKTVSSGTDGLSAKVFLLSYTEVDFSGSSYAPVEGTVLDYFIDAANSKRKAYMDGTAAIWWLRTPNTSNDKAFWWVTDTGKASGGNATALRGVRPALVISSELNISTGAITGQVKINGVMRELTGEGYINVDGVLRELSDAQVNIGGPLKSLKG